MCTDSVKESLVGYLYSELAPEEQRTFEAHLKSCAACRAEVAALRSVRDDLLAWAPPECRELPSSWADVPAASPAPMARLRAWMPAFGLAAAAMLVLAVSAAIANVEIRYDSNGLVVRAGRTAPETASQKIDALATAPAAPAVTAADLSELERRVMQSFAASSTRQGMQTVALTSDNPQLSREVRRLIEQSEERGRQEMANRFLEIVQDFEGHRRADMLRVQQAIQQGQRSTGAELTQMREALRAVMAAQNQTPQR
jgi:hypothetical protein